MKPTTLPIILLPLITTTSAWTFTWRSSSGETTTESGRGPSDCIVVNHAQGELFELDGENEPNINMLLFTNDECSGDPAGQATESFSREASVDIRGFQVVEYGVGDETSSSGTATETGTEDEATFTLPTVSETGTGTATETGTGTGDEDEDGTITLPTVTPTSTSTESEGESETETPSVNETETSTVIESTSTDPPATATDSEEPDSTPTDAASSLILSRTGLVGVAMSLVAGVWALDLLF